MKVWVYGDMKVHVWIMMYGVVSIQCGAVSFVETIRAKNLRIAEAEFNEKMGYVDGKTDIDLFLEEGEVEEEEDQERLMVIEVSLHTHSCMYSVHSSSCSLFTGIR